MSRVGLHESLETKTWTAGQFLWFLGKNKLSNFNMIWITFRALLEPSERSKQLRSLN